MCSCVNMGEHACTVVHNLQKKKKASHRVYVHLQLTQPASISFHSVKLNWFHLFFATCLFPIQVHRVGGLACARQQGSKAGKQFIMEIAKTNTFTPVYIWDFSVPARLARRRSSVSHPPFYASLCILSALFVALTSNE